MVNATKAGIERTPTAQGETHEAQRNVPGVPGFDAADEFEHRGWRFFCSGEQLPDGTFHAVVRYRAPSDDLLRTLRLGNERFASSTDALSQAREMATQWAASNPPGPTPLAA